MSASSIAVQNSYVDKVDDFADMQILNSIYYCKSTQVPIKKTSKFDICPSYLFVVNSHDNSVHEVNHSTKRYLCSQQLC